MRGLRNRMIKGQRRKDAPIMKPFEEWLMKNEFTEFGIIRNPEGDRPEICTASADIHFFRTSG